MQTNGDQDFKVISCSQFLELQKDLIELKTLFQNNISELKRSHEYELQKRDEVITNLQTRLSYVEKKSAINGIVCEQNSVSIDNNEQYARRHTLRITGLEKGKQRETANDVLEAMYDEMDYLNAPIDELEIDRAHRTGKKYKDENGSGNNKSS